MRSSNEPKPPKTLRDLYASCPDHPASGIKRAIDPQRDDDGKGFMGFQSVCAECGRVLSKKS